LELLIQHRSPEPAPGAGDAVAKIATITHPRGRASASTLERLPVLPIAVGAIFVAVVFAYLFARPTAKVAKPSAALTATQAPPSPAVARKPVASEVPESTAKGVAIPSPVPAPAPAAASPSPPAVASRAETPKKSASEVKEVKVAPRSGDQTTAGSANVAKSRNSAASTRTTGEAAPDSDTPSQASLPPEEARLAQPSLPPEVAKTEVSQQKRQAAAEGAAGGAALAARTEPSLRKSHACPTPTYPPDSLTLREEGTVELRFLIDVDGNVAEAKIATSSGSSRLDTAARDVLSRCQFVPGTVNGKPEPSWARLRYTWRLD
jgi:TonB family protein